MPSVAWRRHALSRLWSPLGLAMLMQACVFVPKTTQVYDAECRVVSKKMEMEPVQLASLHACNNSGCGALLAAAGATAVASAVISGSIVIVGNAVYWLEKRGRCLRDGVAAH